MENKKNTYKDRGGRKITQGTFAVVDRFLRKRCTYCREGVCVDNV